MIENNKPQLENEEESDIKDEKIRKLIKAFLITAAITFIIVIICAIVIFSLNFSNGGSSCNGNNSGTCPIH